MAKGKYDAAGNIIRGLVDETALGGKLASDPRIQGIIAKNMAGMDPALAARVRAGDPAATLEAYQSIVAGGGRLPARQMELPMGDNQSTAMIPYGQRGPGVPVGGPRGPGMSGDREAAHRGLRDSWPLAEDADEADVLAALPEFAPEQRQYLQALQANDWLGFDYPSQAASSGLMADAAKRWEMSPDLVAARQSLINSRLRGPGVRQPQETGMIPAPLRGIPGEGQRRLGSDAGVSGYLTGPGVPLDVSDDVARAAMPDFSGVTRGPMADLEPDFSYGSPLHKELQASKRRYDSLRYNRMPNLRNQDPQLTRIAGDGIRTKNAARQDGMARDAEFSQNARGLAAAGAGGLAVLGGANMAPDLMFGPDDTAGLAEESRPIPSVEATPDEAPAMPEPEMPEDYSFQARELMNQLNAMRRQAGGEVPEAPEIMAEINRLLGMSNQQRNAPDYQPTMPTDYHGEAQRLLQKLNEMNGEMGGMSPETPKIMDEVRRLQAMGDQMRNAR
jgi:hypothetical protein